MNKRLGRLGPSSFMGLFCCKDWPDHVSQAFPGHPLPKHSCWAYSSAASLSPIRRSLQNQGNTFWGMSLFEAFVFGFNQNFLNTLKAKLLCKIGPGHPAQLVRDLPWYAKVAGSIPHLDTYKNQTMALAGVVPWIEHWPANQEVAGSIPSQGTCLGCRRWGWARDYRYTYLSHIDVSLSPFTSF